MDGAPVLLSLLLLLILSACAAPSLAVSPVSDRHRSAAREMLLAKDGSFGSFEETYEALRTLEILGIEKDVDVATVARATCPLVVESVKSPSTGLEDLYSTLRVNGILGCDVDAQSLQDVAAKLQKVVKDASSLLDFYYSIGGLLLIKKQGSDVVLTDAGSIFHSVKALSQSDGRWRYNTNTAESSTQAAGIALETLAGIISLAAEEVDQTMVSIVKNDIVKLFDSIKSYDDGSFYFDEEHVDVSKYKGPLSTTASVIRGVASFSVVSPGKINIQGDKILGLAKFFLTIGIPGSTQDLFYQMESLSYLENNRFSVPLILSLPATVLSSSSKDLLKVKVTTVFGLSVPSVKVNLKQASITGSKVKPVLSNQELEFDPKTSTHILDIFSKDVDVGKYSLVFEVILPDPEHADTYFTASRSQASIFVTGLIKIDDAEIAVVDADAGSVDTKKKLDLSKEKTLSLSATHLQKLRFSFKLTTPIGRSFKPHQAFLKLIHETTVPHIFILENSGNEYSKVLDFLGLVEKMYYLSGKYDLQLTVGDAVMENSFLVDLGYLDLDFPDPPEKAPQAPLQPTDPYLRFGPKSEISHIFRSPEKLPPKELSLAFSVLTLLPLLGFLGGLLKLGVNLKNFPSSSLPLVFSILFHGGIAAVLGLYALFWVKLDLFTTLKVLGVLGVFLVFVGHGILSHIASISTKLKSS